MDRGRGGWCQGERTDGDRLHAEAGESARLCADTGEPLYTCAPAAAHEAARTQRARAAAAHPLLALDHRLAAARLHHVAEQLPEVQRGSIEHLRLRGRRHGGREGGQAQARCCRKGAPGAGAAEKQRRRGRKAAPPTAPWSAVFPSAHAGVQAAGGHEALPDLARRERRAGRAQPTTSIRRRPRRGGGRRRAQPAAPPRPSRTSKNCSRLRTTGFGLPAAAAAAGALAGVAAPGGSSAAAAAGSGSLADMGAVPAPSGSSMAPGGVGAGPASGALLLPAAPGGPCGGPTSGS